MLTIGTTGIIYVAVEPQDGRKGIDGLAGVVRTTLGRGPASGDLFVFKNRRGDKLQDPRLDGRSALPLDVQNSYLVGRDASR